MMAGKRMWTQFRSVLPKFALATLAIGAMSASQAADRALLIGVGDYQFANDLPGIDFDIETMTKVARNLGFAESSIKVVMDQQATLKNVEHLMRTWLVDGVGANDRVLLYFSGHGTQEKDRNGDEDDGADEALAMYDIAWSGGQLKGGALIDDQFHDLLQGIPSQNVLLVVDACHSGTGYKSFTGLTSGSSGGEPKFLQYPGMPAKTARSFIAAEKDSAGNFAAVMAAGDGEESIATSRGSLFTLGVADAFEKAVKARENLTPRTLTERAGSFVKRELSARPATIFTPQVGGDPQLIDKPLRVVRADANWRRLEQTASKLAPLEVSANKREFSIGDRSLRVSVRVPDTGYLNIVTVDPDDHAEILFPNKFHSDNSVRAGSLSVPTQQMNFDLKASGPRGDHLVVALWSAQPVNLYKEGKGEHDNFGNMIESFASLSGYGLRSFEAVARQAPASAGKLVLRMTK